MSNKVTFKFILTSDPNLPFKTYNITQTHLIFFNKNRITVPEDAPFSSCLKFVAEKVYFPNFEVKIVWTKSSNMCSNYKRRYWNQSRTISWYIVFHKIFKGNVFLKHGTELKLIPRDRVGFQ